MEKHQIIQYTSIINKSQIQPKSSEMEIITPAYPPQHKKCIDLNYILEINNYSQSLHKWIDNFKHKNHPNSTQTSNHPQQTTQNPPRIPSEQSSQQQFKFHFDKYLRTIKPVINNFSSLTSSLDPKFYCFYSSVLQKRQIDELKSIFEPLNKFETLEKSQQSSSMNTLSKETVQKLIEKREPIYKMDLSIPPQNEQINYWGSTIPINKFIVEGFVIKGKGLGKSVLGMPTANIQISPELNESLQQYPNGIYITKVTIKGRSQQYIGASSLGTNPHYENSTSRRILETYIVHDFQEEDLYGQTLITEFHELIRLEFKFRDFSAFLNGMRNDIQVAKEWGQRAGLSKL